MMFRLDIFRPLFDIVLAELPEHQQPQGQGLEISVVAGKNVLGELCLPLIGQRIRKADLCDAIATKFATEIASRWFGNAEPVTLLRQIWNRPDWSLEQFQTPNAKPKIWTKIASAALPNQTNQSRPGHNIDVASGWLSLDLLSDLPEQLTVRGDHLRVGLCWGLEPIGAISFGAIGLDTTSSEASFTVTAQQLRAAFSQSYAQAMGRALIRSLLGRSPAEPWRVQLQQSGIGVTAARGVTVIVPAFNAEQYLAHCLQAVLEQTYAHWELILVDDGSSDATLAIAQEFAQRDRRLRIFQQPNQGSCAARNNGARLANYEWLAFLDADDWWKPSYLASLMAVADADPTLDAVRCSWNRVTADGTIIETFQAHHQQSAFRTCVLECGLQVSSCIMRRALFEAVQGFNPEMVVSQDWDFWPRIARTGARFGIVGSVQSFYRTVPRSISSKPMRLLDYSLAAIDCCYGSDPRLLNPDPRYANGLEPSTKASVQFHFSLWCAGLAISQGEDPLPLLAKAPRIVEPAPTANSISDYLKSVVYRSGQPPANWPKLWAQFLQPTEEFVAAIGEHLGFEAAQPNRTVQPNQTAQFTNDVLRQLEYKLLVNGTMAMRSLDPPITLGRSQARAIELTHPLPKLSVDPANLEPNQALGAPIEQLICIVFCAGDRLGHLLLPLSQGCIDEEALADAVAREYYWVILQQYLARNVYAPAEVEAHDELGWEKFLQSLFEQPDWSSAQFYEPERDSRPAKHLSSVNHPTESYQLQRFVSSASAAQPIRIELSQTLPVLVTAPEVESEEIEILVTLSGKALCRLMQPHVQGKIQTGQLRTAILEASQLDLCRMVVREGLLWQPLEGRSLRQRLQKA